MEKNKKSKQQKESVLAADKVVQDLAKIAFSNVLDFARFEPDGSVHIFDWEKACDIGAKVSVTTRKMGRGKNAREVRVTTIRMPDKFPALIKLLGYLSPPPRKRK